VLEKCKLIIENRDTNADEIEIKREKLFDNLIEKIDPFPMNLLSNVNYKSNELDFELLNSLTESTHPPSMNRANFVLSSVKKEIDNSSKYSLSEQQTFQFGISMSQALLYLFYYSKEDLLKN